MDNEFWDGVEQETGSKIPKYLKNVLIMNGYNNTFSLSKIDDDKIASIEAMVREDLSDLLPLDAVKKFYYGLYENKPEKFKVLSGHVILLKDLSAFYGKKAFFKPQENQNHNESSLQTETDYSN